MLWSNTTLGLLLYWWHANKQQVGRGSIGIQALETLPVLDTTALTQKQLTEAAKLFDTMRSKTLQTFNEIDLDPTRKELDEQFFRKVLGIKGAFFEADGPLPLLRLKLSRERTILGHK